MLRTIVVMEASPGDAAVSLKSLGAHFPCDGIPGITLVRLAAVEHRIWWGRQGRLRRRR